MLFQLDLELLIKLFLRGLPRFLPFHQVDAAAKLTTRKLPRDRLPSYGLSPIGYCCLVCLSLPLFHIYLLLQIPLSKLLSQAGNTLL